MQHEAGEGEKMQASQDVGQPLVVAGQPTEAGGPGEPALEHPALGQQDKAVLGLRQLDDLQTDTLASSGFSRNRWAITPRKLARPMPAQSPQTKKLTTKK